MNNDLISREALLKALKSNCDLCHDKNTNWCENCCPHNDFEDLIDNAPTVEANSIIDGLNNEIDDLSENLAWYINERNRLLKERRPKGEWEKIGEIGLAYKCNKCGEVSVIPTNFCHNCGAKMKGGAE